jgi:hypothetical protein
MGCLSRFLQPPSISTLSMHPILSSRARFLLYLAVWGPLLVLLAYVSRPPGGSWLLAAGSLAPACLVFAFACLSPWYLCRVLPLQLSALMRIAGTWAAAAAGAGGLLAGLAWLTAQFFGQPIPNLSLPVVFGAILFLLSAGLHYTALAAEASRAAEQRATEARSLARDAELHALRMQINPHFLFNSLHSIAALATQDGLRARDMCVRLSEFLRGSLGLGGREDIPLREELALARSYLSVEQVRFGARLKIAEDVAPACQNCGIPALLLQPLVENAVKHGIAGMLEGGEIRLTAVRRDGQVVVTLENPFDPDAPAPPRLGMGLAHVRRRLEVRYAAQARLETAARDGIYRAELQFPCA